jgi:hypothetical protein
LIIWAYIITPATPCCDTALLAAGDAALAVLDLASEEVLED